MGKLYVIMGKSAAGKDSLYHCLVERHPELRTVITYTTRPLRKGEENGKEYYFVNEKQMEQMRQDGKIAECRRYDTVHGPWYYFTADDGQIDFEKSEDYVIISTLEGYVNLKEYYGSSYVEPIYIVVDDFLRLERALEREKCQQSPCVAEVCRRFLADEEDFAEEKLRHAEILQGIWNHDFEQAMNEIEKQIYTRINEQKMV